MRGIVWQASKAIPREVCSMWVEEHDSDVQRSEVIVDPEVDSPVNTDIRCSESVFVSDVDIVNSSYNIFKDANITTFGFDIVDHVTCQYTRYNGSELGFYDWHIDTLIQPTDGGVYDRKLTSVLMLSDRGDYKGGDLLVGRDTIKFDVGDVVVFPSWMPHKVKPVTSGTRRVLVSWVFGPQFR